MKSKLIDNQTNSAKRQPQSTWKLDRRPFLHPLKAGQRSLDHEVVVDLHHGAEGPLLEVEPRMASSRGRIASQVQPLDVPDNRIVSRPERLIRWCVKQ